MPTLLYHDSQYASEMTVSRNILFGLAAIVAKVQAANGPAFSTGPTSSDTYIVESWATLTLPEVPSDNSGDLSLWVGMGTSNGDLIQSIAENYATSDWSCYAYTLISTSDTTQEPIQAEGSTANAAQDVTFHYKYDDSTGNYTQTVYIGSNVVSTLSTSDGKAEGWGSAVECAAEDCGTVGAHKWSNVSITLNSAYAGYIDTLALGTDVEATMSTSDGGITWEVGTISIPSWDFTTESVVSSSSTSSSSSAASSGVSSSYSSSGASSSGIPAGSSGSSSSGSEGAQPSGTATSGSAGSSTSGSQGSSSSSTASSGSGSAGGSSTWGSAGSSPSGTPSFGSGGEGGSSTWGSPGSQSSGTSSFGGFGSSQGGAWGAQPSQSASTSYDSSPSSWGSTNVAWKRSRISRHQNGN